MPVLWRPMTVGVGLILGLGTIQGALAGEDEVTERERSAQELPQGVASAIHEALEQEPDEMEEIRYEGIPVLYEGEYAEGGETHEVYVFPDGEVAERHSHPEGEEEEEEGY